MTDDSPRSPDDDFAAQASASRPTLLAEFWDFLKYNKKWWLTPIVLALLLISLLVILSQPIAPLIYTLF